MGRSVVATGGLEKLPYIDCVRGYAIILVISSHAAYLYPELPYPVHRLAVLGWFGVQLFFLASCVTLLRSWHSRSTRSEDLPVCRFFIRRFCRIVPAYYLAALCYGMFADNGTSFTVSDVLRTVSFVNALSPAWAYQGQSVVPGGWSVGVEFAFYGLFPLFAEFITSIRRAALAVGASLIAGVLCNHLAASSLESSLSPSVLDNGLFFWFPNQLCVFALGAVLYFVLAGRWRLASPRAGQRLAVLSVALCCGLAYVKLPHSLGTSILPPTFLVISLVFCLFILALSASPPVFVNRAVAAMGRVSFSAYLIHFAVLHAMHWCPGLFRTDATGFGCVLAFAIALPVAVLATYAVSLVTYRYVEAPGIEMAKSVTGHTRGRATVEA